MSSPSHRADLLGGAGWIAFGAAIVAGAWRMDRFEAMGATPYTMPGLVPGIVGAALMLLGAALMLRASRGGGAAPAGAPLFNRRVLVFLALSLAYAAGLLGRVPFALATALYVGATVALFDPSRRPLPRRLGSALVAGASTSLVVVLVFERVFLVRLP